MDLERITIDPNICHGKPTVRGLRIMVSDILEMLAGGMSYEEILTDYPYLEKADIEESLKFAAKLASYRQYGVGKQRA